jgi:hypothetical protein
MLSLLLMVMEMVTILGVIAPFKLCFKNLDDQNNIALGLLSTFQFRGFAIITLVMKTFHLTTMT